MRIIKIDVRRQSRLARVQLLLGCWCGLALILFNTASVGADVKSTTINFDIKAGDLASALNEFAQQSDLQILVPTSAAHRKQSRAIHGSYETKTALDMLLKGTGLVARFAPNGTIVVTQEGQRDADSANAESRLLIGPATGTQQGSSDGASDQTPPASDQTAQSLAEVIVTGRKREESLLDAPVVESVVSRQALEQFQTPDLIGMSDQVPGLLIGSGVGAFGAQVSIRGVGTTLETATVDQDVLLNVDGLPLGQGLAYNTALFDVAQAEVLKGPEPLLYGKNSTGGVISLRSADPTDQTDVILRTGYEVESQEWLGQAIFSGPVTPWLKARLAAQYSDDEGYFKNRDIAADGFGMVTPTTSDYQAEKSAIVRGTVLLNPTDAYSARLKLNYSYDFVNYGGEDEQMAACPYGLTSFTGLPVFDSHDRCALGRNVYDPWMNPAAFPGIRNNGIPFTKAEQEFGSLEQNLHLGPMTLTSVTGFYEVHQQELQNGNAGSALITLAPDNDFSTRQFTEELRLASDFRSPVNFVMGGFYENSYMVNSVVIRANTAIPGIPLPGVLQDNIQGVDVNSISGFGQILWKITNQLELDGGARVTHEARHHTEDNFSANSGPLGPTPLLDPGLSTTNTSPEVTLTYKPTDTLTLFGSYKQGFKSGSFNTVVYYDPNTSSSFGDEKVDGGEIGLKTRLFDRRLSLNLAGYYYHYSGLQVGADEISPTGVIVLNTLNAASAKVEGVDFDASYAAPIDGLTLHGAVNYNHAIYESFPNAPCSNGQLVSEGCNQLFSAATGVYGAQNLTGRPLPHAPRWAFVPGADYQTPLGSNLLLSFGALFTYTSSYYTDIIDRNAPGYLEGGYGKTDLSIGLKRRDDAWELALIGDNIGDKVVAVHCDNAGEQGAVILGGEVSGTNTRGPGGDDYPTCTPERGRAVWLRLTFHPLALF
jgi:iron complex outermembrane recepter protein